METRQLVFILPNRGVSKSGRGFSANALVSGTPDSDATLKIRTTKFAAFTESQEWETSTISACTTIVR